MTKVVTSSKESISKLLNIYKSLVSEEIYTVFEFGSRYGEDAIEFVGTLTNVLVHSFECNPAAVQICKENIKSYPRIKLNEFALSDEDGKVKFYPINPKLTKTTWADGNLGASSMFVASGDYPVEDYVQDEIEVDCMRLDTYCLLNNVENIDIVWMDVQGAELLVLKGLGTRINSVNCFHLEVEFFEIYKNQPLWKEVRAFLEDNGFHFVGFTNKGKYSGDAVFVRSSLILNKRILRQTCNSNLIIREERPSINRKLKGVLVKFLKRVF